VPEGAASLRGKKGGGTDNIEERSKLGVVWNRKEDSAAGASNREEDGAKSSYSLQKTGTSKGLKKITSGVPFRPKSIRKKRIARRPCYS